MAAPLRFVPTAVLTLVLAYTSSAPAHTPPGPPQDGSIEAWGWNSDGQTDVPSPNSDFIAVAGGWIHSLGLKQTGSIVGWGWNAFGQTDTPSPNTSYIAVAAGGNHSLGLKADGTIVAWGQNADGQTNVPSPNSGFVAVAAGYWHSVGLRADGSIVAWGRSDDGQTNVPSPNSGFVAVACGRAHNLGLKSDGSIVAWGNNIAGQTDVPSPNSGFVTVAAGGSHSLGLKQDGSIVAWGHNVFGQTNVPSPNSDFVAMAGGIYHSLGLKQDGSILAWGYNNHGQTDVPSPSSGFVVIAAGAWHSLGLYKLQALCEDDADCNDEDACTVDNCIDSDCVYTDVYCNDGNACTDDSCDPEVGCVYTDVVCDDGDSCTADSCDPATGCIYTDIEQTLIIKQGACPAPVNPNSNGVIPILLVGDVGFDVNNIDLDSLDLHRCDGVGGSATPLAEHTKVKDLNHPSDSVACGECQCNDDQSSDGINDLSMKFRTDETLAALGIVAGDDVMTVELTGTMLDGSPFCAHDCVVVVPPGSGLINATMQSNVPDTFIEMTPLDLNIDSDGFADFTRVFVEGTTITLTAPITSEGRRFLRWSIDGTMQGFGIRTIEVTISEDTALKAFYQRRSRVVPELPSEGSGDME